MKKFLLLAFLISYLPDLQAQYPKHIIRLKNKGTSSFSISNPSQYLSPRALQRRTRHQILIDSFDIPVHKRYIDSIRAAGNVTILSTSKWLNQVLIQTTNQAALTKINSFPFVESSQPVGNRIRNVDKFDEDLKPLENTISSPGLNRTVADYYNYGSSYQQVHIHEGEYLHNKGFRGENIQITVLDAGFNQYNSITAFDSIRQKGQVLGERDFVAFDNSVSEDDAHGMFCLSIMAANWPGRMVGTAPKANYWLIRTENAFSEFPIEEHNWVVGAEFADSTGSDMISSSLGYYDFDDPAFNHTYAQFYKNSTMVTRGATMAAKKGMIVMNSAGNEGNKAWKYIGFPADADSVCAVGAVNSAGQIASFSSFGYPGKVKPNIVSVGQGTVIAGFNNQPVSGNGTSFSNPNVAGLIACLWQAFPQFNNMKILDAVYKSSDRYNNPDDRYGFGIPNFRIAYDNLQKEVITGSVSFANDWFIAAPNPFRDDIKVYLKSPDAGKTSLRLLDAAGRILQIISFDARANQIRRETFQNTKNLAADMYFIQYISENQKRVKKVIKM